MGKYAGYVVAITASGVAINQIDKALSEKESEKKLKRQKFDCEGNDYGCIGGYCWTNCGPRLKHGDWCYVTSGNITEIPSKENDEKKVKKKSVTAIIPFVLCENKKDCDPCLECLSSCILESGFHN